MIVARYDCCGDVLEVDRDCIENVEPLFRFIEYFDLSGEDVATLFIHYHGRQILDEDFFDWLFRKEYDLKQIYSDDENDEESDDE